jgi:hypothetical protein
MFVSVGCLQISMEKTQVLWRVLTRQLSDQFVACLEHKTLFSFIRETCMLIFPMKIYTNTENSNKNKYTKV